MKNNTWNKTIKNNFNSAATNYLSHSNIQRYFAEKIVSFVKGLNLKKGELVDLGSGTGLLADEIEKEFSTKKITRIDFSEKLILQNKKLIKKPNVIELSNQGHCLTNLNLYQIVKKTLDNNYEK